MTREFELHLKQLFRDADVDLQSERFTAGVMDELLRLRRRERRIWSSSFLAALAFLWLLVANFAPALGTVAAYPPVLADAAAQTLVSLSRSPLVHVYGVALMSYLLLRLARRFHLRLI